MRRTILASFLALVGLLPGAASARTLPPSGTASSSPSAPAGAAGASEVAFSLAERDLIPVAIAHDPATGTFYLGSYQKRKIVAVGPGGAARDFTERGQDGLWTVMALRVDAAARRLWAATDGHMRLPAERGRAGIFRYDLATGRLIRKYLIEDGSRRHLLNDMVLSPSGELFVTDSLAGALYRIAPDKDELEPFTDPNTLSAPNGVAISDDGRHLFVGNALGVAVLDTATKAIHDLRATEGMPLTGLDGLYFHQGSLVGIQNRARPERVIRYHLDPGLKQVTRAEILESGHPLFDAPTTGVLAGDLFYYIANSQRGSYDEQGRIWPLSRLAAPVVLRLKLSPRTGLLLDPPVPLG